MSDQVQVSPPVATDLFEKRWVAILLFLLIPGAIFTLICAGIRVSQYGIDHTIVVLCQKQLVPGQSGVMRITLIDDDAGFFLPERVSAKLIRDGRRFPLFDGEVLSAGYAVARNFKVPRMPPGNATLEIHVYFDNRQRVIRKPVELVSSYPLSRLTYPSDVRPDAPISHARANNAVVRLFPEGRGAPAGLPSLLFVQTTDDGDTPLSAPYRLQLPVFKKGESPRVVTGTTDTFGLDAFVVSPTDLQFPILVSDAVNDDGTGENAAAMSDTDMAADRQQSPVNSEDNTDSDGTDSPEQTPTVHPAVLMPTVVYSGMKLDFREPIVGKGEKIELKVQGISGGEPLYLDVYQGNRWVYSTTGWLGDEGRASFVFKPPATGILRIQVTASPIQYSRNVVVRHIYARSDDENDAEIIEHIAAVQKRPLLRKWLFKAAARVKSTPSESPGPMLAAFALSTLYQGHAEASTLVSSRKDDDAELIAFKKSFQTGLMIAILLLGGAVSALIAVIAWQSARRQKLLTRMILEEDDEIGELPDDGALVQRTTARWAHTRRFASGVQVVTLFLVILAAFTAIALLVMTMSWYQL